jgi:hypothetical protein
MGENELQEERKGNSYDTSPHPRQQKGSEKMTNWKDEYSPPKKYCAKCGRKMNIKLKRKYLNSSRYSEDSGRKEEKSVIAIYSCPTWWRWHIKQGYIFTFGLGWEYASWLTIS